MTAGAAAPVPRTARGSPTPRSGGSPPASGWNVTPPSAGTLSSRASTSSGVPTTYCGDAFRSSTVVGVHARRRVLARRLERRVRLRLVQHVRADLGPRLLGIVGDVHERRAGRRDARSRPRSRSSWPRRSTRRAPTGRCSSATSGSRRRGRPPGRGRHAPADEQHRVGIGRRLRA